VRDLRDIRRYCPDQKNSLKNSKVECLVRIPLAKGHSRV
jgi:hypothetical protein